MSTHIGAAEGAIADRVLLPGDPLRAQYIANNFLRDVTPYNTLRNMLGFTGFTPDGHRVSVQGSGMGMPSLSIYVNELISEYGVMEIIRVGSCGALQRGIRPRDIIIAQGSCSDSNMNRRRFRGMDFAPLADWDLLFRAHRTAGNLQIPVRIGNILAADMFYNDADPEEWKLWASYGVLAVEMETAELYTLAARKGIQALSILTVSDCLPTGEQVAPKDRENTFTSMVHLALKL